jgi:hypothetical protein
MRTVPKLHFRFDESVGRGRDMEALLKSVKSADSAGAEHSDDISPPDLTSNTERD